MINFTQALSNRLKHCISAKFLLMEGYVKGALRKELHITPFVECFKTTTLKCFTDSFYQYLDQNKMLKHCIFADFLLIEG